MPSSTHWAIYKEWFNQKRQCTCELWHTTATTIQHMPGIFQDARNSWHPWAQLHIQNKGDNVQQHLQRFRQDYMYDAVI
jgi:hypothetical protein